MEIDSLQSFQNSKANVYNVIFFRILAVQEEVGETALVTLGFFFNISESFFFFYLGTLQ
jgi:hypothetical protein